MTAIISDVDLGRLVLEAWAKGLRKDTGGLTFSDSHDEARNYVGMSSAGGCQRQAAFAALPEVEGEPYDSTTLVAFRSGHLLEADSREALRAGGLYIESAGREFGVNGVYGHIDGLCFLRWDQFEAGPPYEGERILFEHKTLRSYPFRKMLGQKGFKRDAEAVRADYSYDGGHLLIPGTLRQESPHNEAQMQCYMHAIRLSKLAIDRAIYFGRGVEQGEVCVEIVRFHEETAVAEMTILEEAVSLKASGQIPPRSFDPHGDAWNCRYCSYRTLCIEAGDGVLAIDRFLEGADVSTNPKDCGQQGQSATGQTWKEVS